MLWKKSQKKKKVKAPERVKANGAFWYMAKMKINIYFLLMQNCIELYELLMPCLTIRSEMLPFSGNNQNVKMLQSPPEHFAIGYVHVHDDYLPLGNIALQYVIQNNCRKVWWSFLMISCIFWRSRIFVVEFTKTILWLQILFEITQYSKSCRFTLQSHISTTMQIERNV